MFTLKTKTIYQNIYNHLDKKNKIPKDLHVQFLMNVNHDMMKDLQSLKKVFDSKLYVSTIKQHFFQSYFHVQKVTQALKRFLYIWKFKRSLTQISHDLSFNEIPIHKKSQCICLLHENRKYWFSYRDLLRLWYTSLTNASGFFVAPMPLKNPYNNVLFTKADLYNIYFGLKYHSSLFIPDIIHCFFSVNFHVSKLVINFEHLLRECVITNYVNQLSEEAMSREIRHMLDWYNADMPKKYKILVHDEFPNKVLCFVFRTFLFDYVSSDYSLITNLKVTALAKVKTKLTRFKKLNPGFGRKVMRIHNKKAKCGFMTEAHLDLKPETVQEFMSNHLKVTYRALTEDYSEDEEEEFVFPRREEAESESEEDTNNDANTAEQLLEMRNALERLENEMDDEDSIS